MAKTSSSQQTLNYVTANRFYVEIGSSISASFSECSGLGVNIKREIQHEGGLSHQQRVLLKEVEYSDITLKRGLTDDLTFWDWIKQTIGGGAQKRRSVNILVFNQAGETMQCWTLIGAVPVGWKAPSLQASSSTVAIEELTIAYEGLTVVNKSGGSGGGGATQSNRDASGFFASR